MDKGLQLLGTTPSLPNIGHIQWLLGHYMSMTLSLTTFLMFRMREDIIPSNWLNASRHYPYFLAKHKLSEAMCATKKKLQ